MLDAWASSPSRFREDANAEDDLAHGGYRDRLVVELAQNASDAAGVGGRLALLFDDGVLTAANTGAPLHAAGVSALATLRASAKRSGGTVGRFGVGFAAVAAVSDEVVIASTSGAVRFSRQATYDEVQARASLAEELTARSGRVPLLRLPWPSDMKPPAGYDTMVRIVVRPAATASVEAMLAALDPTLLLVLPGLSRLSVGDRVVEATTVEDDVVLEGLRWRVQRSSGSLDPLLLASRPVEERAQTQWSVTWAVPVDADGVPQPVDGPKFVRAPTPTDDPLSTSAVLAASLPLGPDRRRVQPGPLADAVLDHAASVLVDLVGGLADDPSRLSFVPAPLAAGEVDAVLSAAVLRRLRSAPVLADGRTPRDAVVLDRAAPELVELLADALPGLLPASWSGRRWSAALSALGVRRLDLAALTEVLGGLDRPPSWWRSLYAALPPDADALGALPVPLSDGLMAGGPRGLLVADAAIDLSALGLRVVHPDAAHPLLLRLGAIEAQPRALLEDPRVRAAVEAAEDEEDPEPIVQAVLGLVGAADVRAGELPWRAALPLLGSEGEWRPAGELLLPGGSLAQVVDQAAGFGIAARGLAHDDVLAAVGVLVGFAAVPVELADDVDGIDAWLASLPPGAEPGLVVRDLDLVRPDAWDEALALLDREGLLRLDYVRWWLSSHPVLDGQRPVDVRTADSDPLLEGLYDVVSSPWAVPLGARQTLAEVLRDDPGSVFARLADPARRVDRDQLRAVNALLALEDPDVDPPDHVRAVVDGSLQVVAAGDAVVVDRPDLLPRVAPYAVIPVPLSYAVAFAELLDVALATEVVPSYSPVGGPEHDRLLAPTSGGEQVEVVWVVDGAVDHVVGVEGRARALAWRSGAWERRAEIAAQLRGDASPDERDLDPTDDGAARRAAGAHAL
ncbi:MAG: hypothetical protein JWO88_2875 [Frankiales bacterium]|nr:hypothetical protein [Frankiales bacterium]